MMSNESTEKYSLSPARGGSYSEQLKKKIAELEVCPHTGELFHCLHSCN